MIIWKRISYAIGILNYLCPLHLFGVGTPSIPPTPKIETAVAPLATALPNSRKEDRPAPTLSPMETAKEIHQKEIKMETTLIILKPDCVEKGLSGEVIDRFCKAKFEIVGCKMLSLSESLLKEHYAHLVNLPFFPEILDFMKSKPVIVIALRGEGIIEKIRDLLGPTDSTLAAKGTIRGDYGTDKMRNIAHASDSEESAQNELKRFFKSEELFI
jgi:nucleoside-diphosphate kinase